MSAAQGQLAPHPQDAGRLVADLPSPRVQAHAANLMVLADGTLACVWFGGSMEGRSDICVFMSRLAPGSQRNVIEMQTIEDGKGFNRRITDEQVAGLPIETAPVKRGDAIFFHDLTLHGSCPNVNGQERWSAITTYRDASIKDSSTVWRTAIVLSGQSVNV